MARKSPAVLAPKMPGTVSPVEPYHGCCEWVSNGRCHYAGAHSRNLNGSGPWYCLAHDGCSDAAIGAEIVEQSHREVPKPDYSYEARRAAAIKQMEQRYLARVQARKILERVPGEDDEEMAA